VLWLDDSLPLVSPWAFRPKSTTSHSPQQQQTPGALISPYLWSKLDGSVWADETLSTSLAKACTRAQVPRFKTARWRQFAASITKEKSAAKERASFDIEDNMGDDIKDELDIVALAELSNHSYHTFTMRTLGRRCSRRISCYTGVTELRKVGDVIPI
jgi:hypothetical protein